MGFAAAAMVMLAFSAHSAVVHYHEVAGRRLLVSQSGEAAAAIEHLQISERLGLIRSPEHTERLASALLHSDEPRKARPLIERLLAQRPGLHDWRVRLAATLLIEQRAAEAIAHLQAIIEWTRDAPDAASRRACSAAHRMLGDIAAAIGNDAAAQREFAMAQRLEATFAPGASVSSRSPPASATSNVRRASQP
jgi:hypothetical protein